MGLGYNHSEQLIPADVNVLITHEPLTMILDKSSGTHWGNIRIRNKVLDVKPQYHLFGHAHESFGVEEHNGIIFSNGAVVDDECRLNGSWQEFEIDFQMKNS